MLPITTEQARTRFRTLPPTLQDAVFSEQTAEIIASTIEKFHLAEHRAEDIPTLVGWVLLGFLHIEDLAAEIETTARVPKPVAKEIADSLTIKIFEPLRGALAQFHAPVPDAMTGVATAPTRISIEGMSAAPKIISGTTFAATPGSQKNVVIGPRVMQEVRPAGGAQSPASNSPTPSSNLAGDIGKPIPHFEPKPNIGGAMAAQIAPAQKPKSTGEFARLASQGSAPTPAAPIVKPLVPVTPMPSVIKPISNPMQTTPPAPTQPAQPIKQQPVMLQSDTLPKPIQNAPSLGNSSQKAVDILAGKKMPVPLPMKPTVIEIGGAPKAAPQSTPAPSPARTVNYSGMPQSPTPSAATPGRQITEITSHAAQNPLSQTPPTAPKPPASPMMPSFQKPAPPAPMPTGQPAQQPQSQQQSQTPTKPAGLAPIIVKNFTEGEK